MNTQIDQLFMQHVSMHGLSYGTAEEFNFRKNIFAETNAMIEAANKENAANGESLVLGHNFMSTWTEPEKNRMLGYMDMGVGVSGEPEDLPEANEATVDWLAKGAVTKVKYQGSCGSCWSFSTTGAIEGAWAIKGHGLASLSEEQFVQCDSMNHGCHGGNPGLAFDYAKHHGINTEENYPYTSAGGQRGSCNKSLATGMVRVKSHHSVGTVRASPSQLKAAVQRQPISVGVAAAK